MNTKRRSLWIAVLLACLMLFAVSCGKQEENTSSSAASSEPAVQTESQEESSTETQALEKMIAGTQAVKIYGFDWGPAVTKTVIFLEEACDDKSMEYLSRPENYTVTERKDGIFSLGEAERKVEEAVCTKETDNDGKEYTRIELSLSYGPEEGSPFRFNMQTMMNTWCGTYELDVRIKDTVHDAAGNECRIEVALDTALDISSCPELEDLKIDGQFTGPEGHTLTYAFYEPENASEENRRPLVIWLHGMGEGGTDPLIDVLGNRVTTLFAADETGKNTFQETMEGAYVLTPQTPTYWMQYDEAGSWSNNPGKDSIYLNDLKALIDDFIRNHHVDPDRVIVGGCSNGGFMTMDMILNYPDMFAAAYPICECFSPDAVTDEMLESIKDLPIWFVYAENDTTVYPPANEEPLIERLKDAEADIHVSAFPDVHDTSGKYTSGGNPYQYNGHWSWIWFFNNECSEDGLSLWQWMSEQKR